MAQGTIKSLRDLQGFGFIAGLGDDHVESRYRLLAGTHRHRPLRRGPVRVHIAVTDQGTPAGQDRDGGSQLMSQQMWLTEQATWHLADPPFTADDAAQLPVLQDAGPCGKHTSAPIKSSSQRTITDQALIESELAVDSLSLFQ